MFCNRRDFLKATLGTSALLSSAAPNVFLRAAAGTPRRDNGHTVLVLIQLSGGNDGLNTLVPYGDKEYARNRPTLALPPKELHKINAMIGFHPRMEAFKRLYDEGHLSVIQGVGSPKFDGSHEGAMRIWHTADPDRPERQTGWLGRVVDHIWHADRTEAPAVFVGSISQPFALNAERVIVPSIQSPGDLMIGNTDGRSVWKNMARLPRSDRDNAFLQFLQRCTL